MPLTYIKQLIAQGEHQRLDFKFGISDSRKIARSISAFSNTEGGTLLIGVKDNGVIAGVRTEEEYYMVEAAAGMYCRPEVPFQAKSYTEDGKKVLEIIIPKNEEVIHYAQDEAGKWLAYIRRHDQNILVNGIWIRVWKRRKMPAGTYLRYTEPEEKILRYLLENEQISLSSFCRMAGLPRKRAENILVNLISLELVQIRFTDRGAFYALADMREEEVRKGLGDA